MESLLKFLGTIKEPLLLFFGIFSGIIIHIIKSRIDEKNEIKKRSRQLIIDSAEKIKELILKIDEKVSNIDFDKPSIENQQHLYVEIEKNIKEIHKVQREISDEKFQSYIDEFNTSFALIRTTHWIEAKLEPVLLEEYKTKFYGKISDDDFHDKTSDFYYKSFENLMNYINTKI